MSFSQIIWKNFQQNIIHYAIYIFSLVLSCCFSFITIKYVHHLNVHQSLSMIQQGTQVGSYFYLSLLLYLLCIRICCLLNDVAMNSDYCKRLV